MNTIKRLLSLCFIAAVAFGSCKKSDDNPRPDDQIDVIGTWKLKEHKLEGLKDGKVIETEVGTAGKDFQNWYMQFAGDGVVQIIDSDEFPEPEIEKGRYSLKEGTLQVIVDDSVIDFQVIRKGNALTLVGELDWGDLDDLDDFDFDFDVEIEYEGIDVDIVRVSMTLEKTDEDPMKVEHFLLGSWTIEQAVVEGVIDWEVAGSETITVADGLTPSVYDFKSDGTVTITDPEDEEVRSGTYNVGWGEITIDLDGEDEDDQFRYAFDGPRLILTQQRVSAEDLFDFIDEFDEYDFYNLLLTLSK